MILHCSCGFGRQVVFVDKSIEQHLGKEAAQEVANGLATYEDQSRIKKCYFHNAQMYFEGNTIW